MPIYEFKCGKCGKRFEKLCPVGENGENLFCPECHGERPQRVMSGFTTSGTGQDNGSGHSGCGSCSSGNCSACH